MFGHFCRFWAYLPFLAISSISRNLRREAISEMTRRENLPLVQPSTSYRDSDNHDVHHGISGLGYRLIQYRRVFHSLLELG